MDMRPEDIELLEALSAAQHEIWAGWMQYVFDNTFDNDVDTFDPDGNIVNEYIIPYYMADKWREQMQTPYAKLSEDEKRSARKQADKIYEVFRQWLLKFAESFTKEP